MAADSNPVGSRPDGSLFTLKTADAGVIALASTRPQPQRFQRASYTTAVRFDGEILVSDQAYDHFAKTRPDVPGLSALDWSLLDLRVERGAPN